MTGDLPQELASLQQQTLALARNVRHLSDSAETRKGLGLVSITERAKLAGGTLTIASAVNAGTRIQARIPAVSHAPGDAGRGTEGQVA